MNRPNPIIELCALMARGELTFATFSEWSALHYGPVLGTAQINAMFEDFDRCLARLSSTRALQVAFAAPPCARPPRDLGAAERQDWRGVPPR